jgi:transposase
VTDGLGRRLLFFLSAGQVSDYKGARHMLDRLPPAKQLLADRGYDADWFPNALKEKGISPCIPPRKKRKSHAEYDLVLYKQRYRIENMFGRIKDWRRVATRYDRCAHTFLSAILIAATCSLLSRLMSPEPKPAVMSLSPLSGLK